MPKSNGYTKKPAHLWTRIPHKPVCSSDLLQDFDEQESEVIISRRGGKSNVGEGRHRHLVGSFLAWAVCADSASVLIKKKKKKRGT